MRPTINAGECVAKCVGTMKRLEQSHLHPKLEVPRLTCPLPLYTVYVYTVYLFTQGRGRGGGGVEPERRLEVQQVTKLGRKYQHDGLYLQSIHSEKHLAKSPFTA